jgi:hypothetical protein
MPARRRDASLSRGTALRAVRTHLFKASTFDDGSLALHVPFHVLLDENDVLFRPSSV